MKTTLTTIALGLILVVFNGCSLLRAIREFRKKAPANPICGSRQPEGGSELPQGTAGGPTSPPLDVTGRTDSLHCVNDSEAVKKKPPAPTAPGARKFKNL